MYMTACVYNKYIKCVYSSYDYDHHHCFKSVKTLFSVKWKRNLGKNKKNIYKLWTNSVSHCIIDYILKKWE